jgi:hypothetical protein
MRILTIDFYIDDSSVTNATYREKTSSLDFDLVIWDPEWAISHYPASTDYRGRPAPSESVSAQLISDYLRRRREFKELLDLGRTLAVFTSPPSVIYADTGEREHSGTGRNRATTRIVKDYDFWRTLPLAVPTVEARGQNLEVIGDERFAPFWSEFKNELYYSAYLEKSVGTPLVRIAGTQRVVSAAVQTKGSGLVLLLPQIHIPGSEDEEEDDDDDEDGEDGRRNQAEERWRRYLYVLIETVQRFRAETGDFALPAWATNYLTSSEATARKAVVSAQLELRQVENTLAQRELTLAELERRKVLMTGSGRGLELAVKSVMETVGFTVEEPVPGRDDLIMHDDDRVVVVEVKGVVGSAAEKHGAQLEKWVSTYHEAHDVHPKGVLVVNAFRELPLVQRTEKAFPDQMLPYCTNRGHCLMTGLQLLGILQAMEEGGVKTAEAVRQSIFATTGIFADYMDWREFLYEEGSISSSTDEENERPPDAEEERGVDAGPSVGEDADGSTSIAVDG